MDGRWLSTSDVARELGRCEETVRRMVAAGKLPAYRFGHAFSVDEQDLAEFMRKSRTGADAADHQAVCG